MSEEWYSKNIDEVHDENSNGDSNVEDGHKLYYKPIGEQLFDFQVRLPLPFGPLSDSIIRLRESNGYYTTGLNIVDLY